MNRSWICVAALLVAGCVSKSDYQTKVDEAAAAAKEAESAKQQLAQLQQQMAANDGEVAQLKGALGIAQASAITDDQKSQLEEAKRAVQEAQERGKLLDDLEAKFKKMIDAGHLKVATRHGRIVLQLHNDVLFATGDAEVKPEGKQAIAEVAATLRGVALKRFQVAGHTDSEPITTETKKKYPSNWELSAARAIAVVKLLVSGGVEPGVLSAAGYGPFDPVASNATPDGQSKNRRIEITLVPNVAPLVAVATADKQDKGDKPAKGTDDSKK
jgi:chemotaxis protein MotB